MLYSCVLFVAHFGVFGVCALRWLISRINFTFQSLLCLSAHQSVCLVLVNLQIIGLGYYPLPNCACVWDEVLWLKAFSFYHQSPMIAHLI